MIIYKNTIKILIINIAILLIYNGDVFSAQNDLNRLKSQPIISNIIVHGAKLIPNESILHKIPYRVGDRFDIIKSNIVIKNLYQMGIFKQILINGELCSDQTIILHINVEEKARINLITIIGNKKISTDDIHKKINASELKSIDHHELKKYIRLIKKMYHEKNYHFVEVHADLLDDNGIGKIIFTIHEGSLGLVKQVRFNGNKSISSKKLRTMLFTREDWILGAFDHAGSYNQQAVEADKYTIENYYQSSGFLHARVVDSHVIFDEKTHNITVVFDIEEGDQYTISNIAVPVPVGQDILEDTLIDFLPITVNSVYSKDAIRIAIERLRLFWGDHGYIYADISPSIQPNEINKTVSISFFTELGSKVYLNRIVILGNKKTRDKIIRRQLLMAEGDLLTTRAMNISKDYVDQLGFFDHIDGVNWKTTRINENTVDLDLLVKEIKTGRFELRLGYGGSPTNMSSVGGASLELHVSERNMFGKGISGNISGKCGTDENSLNVSFMQPWLMDKPIQIGLQAHYAHTNYDEIRKTTGSVHEVRAGGSLIGGFTSRYLQNTSFVFQLGIDSLHYRQGNNQSPQASIGSSNADIIEYQAILNSRLKGGKYIFIQSDIGQDTRNHATHINRGFKWLITSKLGIPSLNDFIGFYKSQIDAHWYTPLIDEYSLVFHMHGHAGFITPLIKRNNDVFVNEYEIPYRELYLIGGPASVRGWLFGQVGPLWIIPEQLEDEKWRGDPVGGKKGLFLNTELIFPITKDMNLKGVVFYDGGSGWETPRADLFAVNHLVNNCFDYRHSIGIGLRMLSPTAMRVDWGFKLDKRIGEPSSEVHFSAYHDF